MRRAGSEVFQEHTWKELLGVVASDACDRSVEMLLDCGDDLCYVPFCLSTLLEEVDEAHACMEFCDREKETSVFCQPDAHIQKLE